MGFSNDGIYRIFGVSLHSLNVDLPQLQKMIEDVTCIYNIYIYVSSDLRLMSFQYIPKTGTLCIHIGLGQLIDRTGVLLLVVT